MFHIYEMNNWPDDAYIKKVVFVIYGDKVSMSDSFSTSFYQIFLDFIGPDIWFFLKRGAFNPRHKETYVRMISYVRWEFHPCLFFFPLLKDCSKRNFFKVWTLQYIFQDFIGYIPLLLSRSIYSFQSNLTQVYWCYWIWMTNHLIHS